VDRRAEFPWIYANRRSPEGTVSSLQGNFDCFRPLFPMSGKRPANAISDHIFAEFCLHPELAIDRRGIGKLGLIERSDTVRAKGMATRRTRLAEWRALPPVCSLGDGGFDSVAWLRRQSPAEWHELVKGYTWDSDDLSAMVCIADQPNADRATILAMLLDLDVTYYENRKSLGGDPRATFPDMTDLLDRIEAGFARGYYQSAEFGLVRDRSQLERTTAFLARLGRAPIWNLPARTWDALQGRGHKPRYVYDARDEAFRMPFEQWARHRAAPN
jgi:hypothetical protein